MDVKTLFRRGAPALSLALLSACAVGPDFVAPQVPEKAQYTPDAALPPTASADGTEQRFALGAAIPDAWWTLFHSEELDSLIRHALAANPDLQAAKAALIQAQELARAQAGTLYPSVSGQINDSRSQESGINFGLPANYTSIYTLTTAQVSVSYALDVFGGERRAIEAAEATARYEAFQLDAAYLTLTANLVTSAIQEASLRGQIAATRDIIADQEHQVGVVSQQFSLGGASKADVLAQQATLAQTRATLPPLEQQLDQVRHQIAALAGNFPNDSPAERFTLDSLTLPVDLPVSLPSDLVRQRPDVRSAEEQLHHASAEVGVAIANELPQFSLTGSLGYQSEGISNLVSHGAQLWSLGGGITQPLFQGGQLLHQRRAADAALDQAAAQYRSAVLTAFRNVADSLRALSSDADSLNAQTVAERSAADSLALSRQQYGLGSINYLSLLNAERTYQQAKIALIQARAARYVDTAALFQALGGGWWNDSALQSASAQ